METATNSNRFTFRYDAGIGTEGDLLHATLKGAVEACKILKHTRGEGVGDIVGMVDDPAHHIAYARGGGHVYSVTTWYVGICRGGGRMPLSATASFSGTGIVVEVEVGDYKEGGFQFLMIY